MRFYTNSTCVVDIALALKDVSASDEGLTPAVSRRRKRRRSAAEPKLEAVGSSAMLGQGWDCKA
jgi:hypothetical protein